MKSDTGQWEKWLITQFGVFDQFTDTQYSSLFSLLIQR